MCLALRVFIEQKQFPEGIDRKVTLCVFLLIDYGRGKGLLGRLIVENIFSSIGARGYETVDKACAGNVVEQTNHEYRRKVGRGQYYTHSFFWPSRQTRAKKPRWSAAGFQSEAGVRTVQRLEGEGLPGSNKIRRLAPMRLIPHPPALLLSKNTNSLPSGSLN